MFGKVIRGSWEVYYCITVVFLSVDIVHVSRTDSEITGVCWIFWKQGKCELNLVGTFPSLLNENTERGVVSSSPLRPEPPGRLWCP